MESQSNKNRRKDRAKGQDSSPTLEGSLSFLRKLIYSIPMGIALYKVVFNQNKEPVNYVFLEANDFFERITGLKRAEILNKQVTEVLPGIENNPADWIGKYGKVALTGEHITFEAFSEPLGKWYHVIAASPEKGFFLALFDDITDRKKSEKELRLSDKRHSLILRAAMDGFWFTDMQGHFLEVNEAYCRMSGYSEQELLTMRVSDLEAVESPDEIAAHVKKVVAQGGDQFESIHRRKDGSTFDVEISAQFNPIEGGSIVGFLRDITARKRAQEQLRVHSQELEEMNCALKVLLKQRNQDQRDLEEKVHANVHQLVLPYVEKLKKRAVGEEAAYLNIIEANLQEVTSSFTSKMSGKLNKLTPQELLVANLIKEGKQDKDIAEMLNSSIHTIKAHRRNIRKKLGLTNKKANLRTSLIST